MNIIYSNIIFKCFMSLILFYLWGLGMGDWGLGIGDWGLGIGPNPQSPIPNPQSPNPSNIIIILYNIQFLYFKKFFLIKKNGSKKYKRIK